ncbi:MAG: hypothetical protein RSG55_03775, partial [Oscillospiraceae bacterium]
PKSKKQKSSSQDFLTDKIENTRRSKRFAGCFFAMSPTKSRLRSSHHVKEPLIKKNSCHTQTILLKNVKINGTIFTGLLDKANSFLFSLLCPQISSLGRL